MSNSNAPAAAASLRCARPWLSLAALLLSLGHADAVLRAAAQLGQHSPPDTGRTGATPRRFTARLEGDTLRIIGNDEGGSVALQLRPGGPNVLEVDADSNGTVDFAFDRTRFTRILIEAGGGPDTIKIVEAHGVFTDTEQTIDGGAADGEADTVILNGTAAADAFALSVVAGAVRVAGPAAELEIANTSGGDDVLVINGLSGADTINIGPNVEALIDVIFNQQ